MVQKVQEARLQVTQVFTSRFEDLVTAGRAAEYPPLVERFKPKFEACQTSLEVCSASRAGDRHGRAASPATVRIIMLGPGPNVK